MLPPGAHPLTLLVLSCHPAYIPDLCTAADIETRRSGLALLTQAKTACGIYVASLTVLFTASALYHRRTWTPSARLLMKRVDHAAIFVLIAGAQPPGNAFACKSTHENVTKRHCGPASI